MDSTLPRAKSCVECRQQKVRCDRAERQPRPCTRCTQRQLPCRYEPYFSRTRRRRRHGSSAHRYTRPTSSVPSNVSEDGPLYIGTEIAIEDVVLRAPEVTDLFTYFITKMHIHFPLLGTPSPTADAILRASPLLFWTIMAITSSFQNRPLYRTLQGCVRRLVTRTLYPFSVCPETCQALCLLCLWPFEAVEPNDDPVYAYAGMATHFALQMGLHRSQHSNEFKNINSVTEPYRSSPSTRLLTWYACVFVEHQLASKIGVPSGIRDCHQLQQQLSSKNIALDNEHPPAPLLITQHVLLACLRERFFNAIAWDGPSSSGLTEPIHRLNLLSLFSNELQRFSVDQAPLELLTLALLHASHIAVGGFALAADLVELKAQATVRQLLIYRAVDSASALLDLVTPLAWETLPIHILRAVLHAGVVAGQIRRIQIQERELLNHDQSATYGQLSSDASDMQTAIDLHTIMPLPRLEQIIDRCIGLLQSVAYGKDFPTRGKIVLEAIRNNIRPLPSLPTSSSDRSTRTNGNWQQQQQQQSTSVPVGATPKSLGVLFESRMAANFYWDAVEHEKGRHNWNQDEQGILQEVMSLLC
ncbi:hypothetical protein UA08_01809 [Talaromyces atroroseus]|uniref:Zn(2)-C6 fungal-type domain-containing protein n=1 Tax=Talaromyces atroroseus TaxID=1441469 RepID=A0A1Q5QBJ2_TALAT|nr:hypothetical protein UA08_01809 [Talaromyces atroroseus]OKL63312.1 hypothetical protein UA08_01809 [Talaromyces atroroseus]